MRLSECPKWFIPEKENHEKITRDVTCKNCCTHFDGNYCPVCGQGVKDLNHPFGFIFINFMGDLFAFDTRFYRTIKDLLFKPGHLTKQFFEGKHVRYAPPTRVFILSSFILFFLLQVYSNRILTKVIDAPVTVSTLATTDSGTAAYSDSLMADLNSSFDPSQAGMPDIRLILDAFSGTQNIREGLLELSNQMEQKLREEENLEEKAKLREQIRLVRNPEQAIAKILRYMSWAFFLLMPVFALILKLLYIRQNQFYIRHLVFAIHFHTFIFFIYILLVALHLIVETVPSLISFLLIATLPVYFFLALKRFYGQSIAKVLLKFMAVTSMYSLLFWLAVGGIFLKALSII